MDDLAKKNRAAFLASIDAYMDWGFTAEERAEHRREDAEYLTQRRAEFAAEDRATRDAEADARIYERQRAHDRAFG